MKKRKEWELSEKETQGEVERKMRQRKRRRVGVMLFDGGEFKMGSW